MCVGEQVRRLIQVVSYLLSFVEDEFNVPIALKSFHLLSYIDFYILVVVGAIVAVSVDVLQNPSM